MYLHIVQVKEKMLAFDIKLPHTCECKNLWCSPEQILYKADSMILFWLIYGSSCQVFVKACLRRRKKVSVIAQNRSAQSPPAPHMTHCGAAEQNIKHTHMHQHRARTKWRHHNNSFLPLT
ncbi:hypothetical protein CHARACLAT_021979 [Characodon lateralis]|uniref:Uncharacterized protein n=1 Tax=Characodon lateralis TaxID=208331 RepID=A0ABU7CQY3_9TELE|nr:hypothetical protein [Characodon lateralis]